MIFLGGMLGTVVSTIKAVVATVGPAVSSMATKLVELAKTYLPKVVDLVEGVAKALNLLSGGESVEEMGRKAKVSDKSPEAFETQDAYLAYLREQKVDAKTIENETEADKFVNMAIGLTLTIKAINEIKGAEIPLETWVALAKAGVNQPEAEALIDGFKGVYDQLSDYIEGKQSPEQELQTGDKLVEVYQTLYPELSDADIESKVMQLEQQEGQK